MDSIQTVAGIETPAEANTVLEEGEPQVQSTDQAESEAGEVEDGSLALEQPEDKVAEPETEALDQAEDETDEQESEALVTDQAQAEAEESDAESQTPSDADTAEMGDVPMAEWDYQRPKRGEIRSGVILSISPQEVIVDVGGKRDGIVPSSDLQRLGEEELANLSVGDQVLVYILRPEDQDGNLLLSLNMARQEKAWRRAQKMADSGEVWEGEVIGYNKGGLVVPVDEIRGFVPASQVPGFPQGLGQEERLQRLADMVGETLQVKVIEINRRKRRLILSATTALRQWRKQQRERLLSELREGEVRTGAVSSLCSFGAFVDLGGADGLIHLSELSWRRVRHPREVLKVGEEVDVYVLRLDHDRGRIGLSLKRLQPEPWALVEDKYELGQLVEGVVTNVVDFGAFAEIDEGVEGLIHVSELAEAQVSHPKDVVKKGDLLLLRIIRIDVRRKRLGLSLKRVLESEWAEWAAQLAVEEAKSSDRAGRQGSQREPVAEELAEVSIEAPVVEPEEGSAEEAVVEAEVAAEVEELAEVATEAAVAESEEGLVEEAVVEAEVAAGVEELAEVAVEAEVVELAAQLDQETEAEAAVEELAEAEVKEVAAELETVSIDEPVVAEEPLEPEESDLPGEAVEPVETTEAGDA